MVARAFSGWYHLVSAAEASIREALYVDYATGAPAEAAPPPPALGEWAEQLSFIPDPDVQRLFIDRFAPFQRIGYEGAGPVNLDLYKVEVTDPTLGNGERVDAEWLIQHERVHFTELMDTKISYFYPYDKTSPVDMAFLDPEKNPLGALLHIMIPVAGKFGPGGQGVLFDDGAVGAVIVEKTRWRVSTVYTWRDHDHPVSGYREWGAYDNGNGGYTLYNRGTDQATGAGIIFGDMVFEPADELWKTWQKALTAYLAGFGMKVEVGTAFSKRFTWRTLEPYYQPTGNWL